jgi:hypothetical protein
MVEKECCFVENVDEVVEDAYQLPPFICHPH